jgi:hypothetical protein
VEFVVGEVDPDHGNLWRRAADTSFFSFYKHDSISELLNEKNALGGIT